MTAERIHRAALELIDENFDRLELAVLCGLAFKIVVGHEDERCPRLIGTGECTCSGVLVQLVHVGPDPSIN